MADSPVCGSVSEGGSHPAPPLLFSPYRLPAARYAPVFERGESFASRYLVMRWLPNGLDKSCLGVISAKRTFRLAVDRSRVRRVMREAFRLERPQLKPGYDLVLMGRRGLEKLSCDQVRKDFRWLCRKVKLMEKTPPHA